MNETVLFHHTEYSAEYLDPTTKFWKAHIRTPDLSKAIKKLHRMQEIQPNRTHRLCKEVAIKTVLDEKGDY